MRPSKELIKESFEAARVARGKEMMFDQIIYASAYEDVTTLYDRKQHHFGEATALKYLRDMAEIIEAKLQKEDQ